MNVPMYGNAYCPLFKMYNFVKFNEWKQKLNEWKLILKIWKNVFFSNKILSIPATFVSRVVAFLSKYWVE